MIIAGTCIKGFHKDIFFIPRKKNNSGDKLSMALPQMPVDIV